MSWVLSLARRHEAHHAPRRSRRRGAGKSSRLRRENHLQSGLALLCGAIGAPGRHGFRLRITDVQGAHRHRHPPRHSKRRRRRRTRLRRRDPPPLRRQLLPHETCARRPTRWYRTMVVVDQVVGRVVHQGPSVGGGQEVGSTSTTPAGAGLASPRAPAAAARVARLVPLPGLAFRRPLVDVADPPPTLVHQHHSRDLRLPAAFSRRLV